MKKRLGLVHFLKEYLYRNLYLIWISDWIFCCSVCLSTSLRPGCSGNNNKKHSLRLNQFKHQSQRKCFLFYSAIFGRWTITCDNDYNQEVDCIEHVLKYYYSPFYLQSQQWTQNLCSGWLALNLCNSFVLPKNITFTFRKVVGRHSLTFSFFRFK